MTRSERAQASEPRARSGDGTPPGASERSGASREGLAERSELGGVQGSPPWKGSVGGTGGAKPPGTQTVALVGAGPGGPDLLTRRAVQRLQHADLVLYDALVDPEALALAPAAQRIFVGKRAGRPAVSQDFINRLMIRAARRGRKVVRLKGGDPFVFGRGGEEALALAAAGIACEIVPGVSAAVAAPALAGIPVTHRGTASAFVVVSGHAEEAYRPVLDAIAPGRLTVVVLMGLAHIQEIAAVLADRGWNLSTPVAVLFSASCAESNVWTTTLGDLQRGAKLPDRNGPGTIVIGDVVRIRALLDIQASVPEHDARDEPAISRSRIHGSH